MKPILLGLLLICHIGIAISQASPNTFFQRTIERLSSASPKIGQHTSSGRELTVSSLPDVNQSDKRIETNLLNLGTGSYLPAMVTLFGALGYGISLLQVGKGTFQTMAASDGRNLRSDLFAMLRDAKLKMAHTRRADADSRHAGSSFNLRKMRILRRRKGRPAFSKRKGARVEASKVRNGNGKLQGYKRRKGKALVETGLSIGRKLKSGASRQGARLKSVVRRLRNKRRRNGRGEVKIKRRRPASRRRPRNFIVGKNERRKKHSNIAKLSQKLRRYLDSQIYTYE